MTKRCYKCNTVKSSDEFHKSRKDGLQSMCIDCKSAYNKINGQDNAEAIAVRKRWYFYKLNDEQYKRMLADQNNSCKTCKIKFDSTSNYTKPNIDHDHECCEGRRSCGKCTRGILCGSCNLMLGRSKDNIQTLQNMINYLKEYA